MRHRSAIAAEILADLRKRHPEMNVREIHGGLPRERRRGAAALAGSEFRQADSERARHQRFDEATDAF
jgi:hypothetical protein